MTREFSTKPRFEDNGDIEPCDTETRMMKRPDDLGVNEASSVKEGAAPRGDDAVISVPLLQSPWNQGQGESRIKLEENVNGAYEATCVTSQTSQVPDAENYLKNEAIEIADNQELLFLDEKNPFRAVKKDVCHQTCSDDASKVATFPPLGIRQKSLLLGVEQQNPSVINSNSNSNYDDSCNKMMTSENKIKFLTTLMIKPSDYDDDNEFLTFDFDEPRAKCPSMKIENSLVAFAAGDRMISASNKETSPKYNAISSSKNKGGTLRDAGAVLSQVATNDIPYDDELPSFNAHGFSAKTPQSLSHVSCASQISRRSGWGNFIGLKGGAGGETSVANGTSGWGPPPSARDTSASSGWGAPPPPNPTASAAWGAPVAGQAKTQNDDGANNLPAKPAAAPTPPISSSAVPVMPVSVGPGPGGNNGPVQPPQTSTSWAAAAGKGLPTTTNDQTHTTSTASTTNGSTSKHLEQLNSVREALFSQDGWGGSNVKQDSAWNVDGISASSNSNASSASATNANANTSTAAAPGAGAAAAAEAKESNMWGQAGPTPRNDGTDLWRVNLSGQPPAPKAQPNNAWNHTPQNNTDFKQWGVDEEDSGGNSNGAIGGQRGQNNPPPPVGGQGQDSMWDQPNGGGQGRGQFKNNDWGSSGSTGSWGEAPQRGGGNGRPPMEPNMGMSNDNNAPVGGGNSGGGWGPSPQKQPISQWGSNQGSGRSNNSTWDLESPNMQRRGQIDDGTSHWGMGKAPQPAAPGPAGVSHWKDMPNSNNQIRGPPGPAGPRLSGPPKDSSIWPRGPTSGWGNDSDQNQMGYGGSSSWGDLDAKREASVWPDSNNSSSWGRPRNPVGPSNGGLHRSSPGWGAPDDNNMDGGNSGWPNSGGLKAPGGPKKPTNAPNDLMWQQSKPYRMLAEMGYRKEDIETALRNSNGSLEDALEVLNNAGRMPSNPGMFNSHNDYSDSGSRRGFPTQNMPPYGPGGQGQDPNLVNNSGLPSSFNSPNPMIQKMLPGSSSALPPSSLSMPPISSTRPSGQPGSQPSAQQLRMLVQQIQMAVQAGHLNPQILNQPLAPQTLLLLNQLLQQIKTLQTLQLNHTQAQAQKGMSNSRELLSISVNITKTKQHITNLQNQISAQQATYLKSQNMGGSSSSLTGAPPSHLTSGSEPSMPDLFNELTLSGSTGNMSDNAGGSRLSQWKLNASDNLFNKGPANNKSSPGLGFGGDDTWGLSSNSTSSGWPDSKPNSGSVPTSASAAVAAVNANTSNANNDVLNGIDAFGIPEFEPGKPWKGTSLKNPDEDPTLTPGSVAPSAIDLMSKTNHNSTGSSNLAENTLGLTSPTWSFNNPTTSDKPKDSWGSTNSTSTLTAMGQDLWGKSGRTPPGMGWPSTTSSSNGWSSGQNGSNNNPDAPTWLLLKNLTPQIDGSTLKTLCIQHGPLKNFHLFLNNGIALVMYASGREANKAQKALNNCLLGNTTIQATMTSEAEANSIIQQLGGGGGQSASRGATPSSSNLAMPKSTSSNDMWGNSMAPATSIYSSTGGNSIWGAPSVNSGEEQRNTPQLQPYLPGDLLGESNM